MDFTVTIAGSLALSLVALSSIPAIKSISQRLRTARYEPIATAKDVYCDEDGEATEESLRAFSDKWQRSAIAVFSMTGFLTTLALAVLTTLETNVSQTLALSWLQFAAWILLSVQGIAFFTEPRPTVRYTLGAVSFTGSLIVCTVPAFEVSADVLSRSKSHHTQYWIALQLVQIASGAFRALCCILLPRRPDVYYEDRLVQQEYSVSLFSRFSFGWVRDLLDRARNKKMEWDDMPRLTASNRARARMERFEAVRKGRPLWKAVLIVYAGPLVVTAILAAMGCTMNYGPHVALFQILKSLELRDTPEWNPVTCYLWVMALGVSTLLTSVLDTILYWTALSKFGIPLRIDLSASIFAKGMRRDNVMFKLKPKNASARSAQRSTHDKKESDAEALKKSRQNIFNRFSTDGPRISTFAANNYVLPQAIFRLILGTGFLIQILGWRSGLAGLAAGLLWAPLSYVATKRLSSAQKKLAEARDTKITTVHEVLHGIRQIKLSAQERRWEKRVQEEREDELGALWKSNSASIIIATIWLLGPIVLSAVSLATYAYLHGGLKASVAFTSLSVFQTLQLALRAIPSLTNKAIQANVSACKIDEFLATPDRVVKTSPGDYIAFDNADVAWPTNEERDSKDFKEPFMLRDVTLKFPPKGLSVVSGCTGSGKSLLLSSIIGECDLLKGTLRVPVPPPITDRYDHLATKDNWIIDSAIAYVAQIPWIENDTIKANILFGLPYDKERYEKVIFACALEKDLQMFDYSDLTEIGPRGINLSGGQRWRVSFARALYSRAGILVMDDIFSALDAHTGLHLFRHALTGELGKGRTRILVTHHVALCIPRTDYSVVLDTVSSGDGRIKYAGPIDDDSKKLHHSEDLLREEHEETRVFQLPVGRYGRGAVPKKFVEEENIAEEAIGLRTYSRWFESGGSKYFWLLTFLVFLAFPLVKIAEAWWINVWTGSGSKTQAHREKHSALLQQSMQPTVAVQHDKDLNSYILTYIFISLLACILGTIRQYLILTASIRAARNLFNGLLYPVLHAPLGWLDKNPLGRILNRFTEDTVKIDSQLGDDMRVFANRILAVLTVFIAGIIVDWRMVFFASALLGVSLKVGQFYLAGARQAKRLESTAKSPIFELFRSSLDGLLTIRAFNKADTYIGIACDKIDCHAQVQTATWSFTRWFTVRIGAVGAIFTTIAAVLVVYVPRITASLGGFALSFALQYNTSMSFAIRNWTSVDLSMNATERVLEYSDIEIEDQGGEDAPAAWPTEGRLEVHDLVVGYGSQSLGEDNNSRQPPTVPLLSRLFQRFGWSKPSGELIQETVLPRPESPVLKGLSFTVESNQRVGVVGRTGAGKSSLTLALFRFLEARSGQIIIDGLDISKIKLHDLRSRLEMIPQDPVLFSGTLRSNLDPFDDYSDSELYDALARVNLISDAANEELTLTSQGATPRVASETGASARTSTQNNSKNFFADLSSELSAGGLNVSQGQRQLVCLARAMIKKPKMMVLDEATSAVDMETDALIQKSIRSELGRTATTLLVIAHRLSTIAEFDRILVMDAGRAVEFGSPKELMGIEQGHFKKLVESSKEKEAVEKMIFG